MGVYFLRLFRDRKFTLLLYCLAGILMLWILLMFFPIIQQQSEAIKGFMDSIPKLLLKAFGIENLDIFTIEGFLTYKHYSMVWPLLLIFLSASLAGWGLSGQVDRGTIEIPLARPISRVQIFFNLYLTGIISLILFTICGVLSIVPLAELYKMQYLFSYHALIAILGLLFGWAVFSFAMLLSAIFSEQRRTYMVLGGTLFVMYILDIVPLVIKSLAWLKYFSLFYYYDPNYILLNNSIQSTSIFVFIGVAMVCTISGAIWFNRRDIAV